MACCFGHHHSVTLDAEGGVWTFGSNEYSQLGYEGPTMLVPKRIESLPAIKSISCGFYFSACLDYDGTVWSFGNNDSYQLGTRSGACSAVRAVENLPFITSVHCGGRHIFCRDENGQFWCYGRNDQGQLGCKTEEHLIDVPFQHPMNDIVDIACGSYFTVVKNINGDFFITVKKFKGDIKHFKRITGLEQQTIKSISCGYNHTLFLNDEGFVFVSAEDYAAGLPTKVSRYNAVQIPELQNIQKISCGYHHSMCVDGEGSLYSFGTSTKGQVGLPLNKGQVMPVKIELSQSVIMTSQGGLSSLVKLEDESLWAWGDNSHSQLAPGNSDTQICEIHQFPTKYSQIVGIPHVKSNQKSARK